MESPHSKKLWAILIPAMFLPGLASLWYFVWLGDSPLAQVIYGSVKFFTLVWPIIATFLILKEKIQFKIYSYGHNDRITHRYGHRFINANTDRRCG